MGRTRTALTLPLVDIAATVADGTATTLPPGKAATLTEGVVYRLAEAIFALHTVLDTTLDTLAPLDFADVLQPVSLDTFRDSVFEQRPLHVRHNATFWDGFFRPHHMEKVCPSCPHCHLSALD